jgi:hypothetical protein
MKCLVNWRIGALKKTITEMLSRNAIQKVHWVHPQGEENTYTVRQEEQHWSFVYATIKNIYSNNWNNIIFIFLTMKNIDIKKFDCPMLDKATFISGWDPGTGARNIAPRKSVRITMSRSR